LAKVGMDLPDGMNGDHKLPVGTEK
jgi:hypothetical protein